MEHPQLWGGLRRAAESRASHPAAQAALQVVQEQPEPQEPPGGRMRRRRQGVVGGVSFGVSPRDLLGRQAHHRLAVGAARLLGAAQHEGPQLLPPKQSGDGPSSLADGPRERRRACLLEQLQPVGPLHRALPRGVRRREARHLGGRKAADDLHLHGGGGGGGGGSEASSSQAATARPVPVRVRVPVPNRSQATAGVSYHQPGHAQEAEQCIQLERAVLQRRAADRPPPLRAQRGRAPEELAVVVLDEVCLVEHDAPPHVPLQRRATLG